MTDEQLKDATFLVNEIVRVLRDMQVAPPSTKKALDQEHERLTEELKTLLKKCV